MQAQLFMYFCNKNYIGTELTRIFVDSKSAMNTPVVYTTDRSKAVVLV